MRPKFLLLIIFVVFVIMILLLWQRSKQPALQSKPAVQAIQSGQSTSNIVPAVAPKNDNTDQITSPQASQLRQVNDRERTNEIRQYMESLNKPVEFYGEVVDQDENPISGAKITGRIHRIKVIVPAAWGDEDQYIPFEKASDSGGRFEIQGGTGTSLGFVITKDGYELEPRAQPNFGPSSGSLQNPVVFKMWSTNIHEQLIIGEKSFEIQPDGKPHVVDLTQGTIGETGAGDLKIWIRYANQGSEAQLQDWAAGIEVISGGLLEEPYGTVMYVAPTDGYTNSFQLQQQIKGGQSGEIGDRSFYLKLHNGQAYGRMNINLYAPYGYLHPGLIRLSYAVNPSGSRILR